jgi:predicted DNA-binding protein (MmcQ/YjbR family)
MDSVIQNKIVEVDVIRRYCLSFAHAKENLQWGDDLCFKVGGKIFAIMSPDAVPQRICFKCAPERFDELLERAGIRVAPYVGRYKWAMLDGLDALPPRELRELIGESYAMVSAKVLPPKRTEKSARRRIAKGKK